MVATAARPVHPVAVAAKPKQIRVVSVDAPVCSVVMPQANQIRATSVSLAGSTVYPVVAAKRTLANPVPAASSNDGFWGSSVDPPVNHPKKKQKKQHTTDFDLEPLTIYELKSELSKRQLKVSGNKEELILSFKRV
jgi:hypothetical protein